jgi:hypothetical protein
VTVPAANPAAVATTASATERVEGYQSSEAIPNKDDGESTSEVGTPDEETVRETVLEAQITELWSSQKRRKTSLRRNRAELATLRNSLTERLHEFKHLLARTGRGGKWAEFLRRENIPLATANRYVEKWKLSMDPKPEKRLTEPFTEPSKEDIAQMVRKLKPKLERY